MPDTLTQTIATEDNAEARCGICKYFEANFWHCSHPAINISVDESSVCNNPCRFEEDVTSDNLQPAKPSDARVAVKVVVE